MTYDVIATKSNIDIFTEQISTECDGRVVIIRRNITTGQRKKLPLVIRDGRVYAEEEGE